MKLIVLTILVSVVVNCVAVADAPFDCIIASDRTNYSVGEIPKITFRIINKSKNDVVLVGSLDGSDSDRRFPKCRFEIFGKPGTILPAGMCAYMNPLRTNDFVLVRSGETFDPFSEGFFPPWQLTRFPVTEPGDYTLRFTYITSDRIQDYFGKERMEAEITGKGHLVAPEIQQLFKLVPKLDLKSNKLKLRFTNKSN